MNKNILRIIILILSFAVLGYGAYDKFLKAEIAEEIHAKILRNSFSINSIEEIDLENISFENIANQKFDVIAKLEIEEEVFEFKLETKFYEGIMKANANIKYDNVTLEIPVYAEVNSLEDFSIFADVIELGWVGITSSDLEEMLEDMDYTIKEFQEEIEAGIKGTEEADAEETKQAEDVFENLEVNEVNRKTKVDIKGIETTEVDFEISVAKVVEELDKIGEMDPLEGYNENEEDFPQTIKYTINYDKNYKLIRIFVDLDMLEIEELKGTIEIINYDFGKVEAFEIPEEAKNQYTNFLDNLFGSSDAFDEDMNNNEFDLDYDDPSSLFVF